MGRIEGIFCDFYGTLASGDREVVETICQSVIDDYGLETTAADLAVKWGHAYFGAIEVSNINSFRKLVDIEADTLVETVQPLAGKIDPEPYVVKLNEYLARPPLFDEVHQVLDMIEVPVCIVSNADEKELRAAIEHHQLKQINYVVTSEGARSYKPGAGIFKAALQLTGWDPNQVIHVGDSLHSDVWGAHQVNLKAAWVCREGRISDIGTEKPDFTWPDLQPLMSI